MYEQTDRIFSDDLDITILLINDLIQLLNSTYETQLDSNSTLLFEKIKQDLRKYFPKLYKEDLESFVYQGNFKAICQQGKRLVEAHVKDKPNIEDSNLRARLIEDFKRYETIAIKQMKAPRSINPVQNSFSNSNRRNSTTTWFNTLSIQPIKKIVSRRASLP